MGERVSASEGTLSRRGAGAMTGTSVGDPPDGGGGEEHRAIEPEDNRRAWRSHATFCQWHQRNRSGKERESKQIFVSVHKKERRTEELFKF